MPLNGSSGRVTVAVDAMGGDHAPHEVVLGAAEAQRRGTNVILVGQPELIEREMSALEVSLPIVPAPYVIAMDDHVSRELVREPSSLRVAIELVSNGEADATVSCGNSAAIMALSLLAWKRLPGIDRPAFGSFLPAREGSVFVLDVGANTMVESENLVQFALMGEVYVRLARGIESPRVGLLSNGSEASKGTKEVKEANEELERLGLNFVGNIEGNQIFEGAVDVVACDGFAGNVLLKVAEGAATEIFHLLREELSRDLLSRAASAVLMPAFGRIRRRVDYQEYGGAPVLGVRGVMINCHGRSKARAVTNAIQLAERVVRDRLTERISEAMSDDGAMHADGTSGRRRRLARALHLRHE